jgi:integrase/recombinase XerD
LAARTEVAHILESEDLNMNHCSPGSKPVHTSILLSKAIDGFLTFKLAEGLSKRTIDSYEHTLRHWLDHIGDLKVSQIKTSDLVAFLAWMRTDYKPRRWNGNTEPLSAKSLRNVYVSLRAFFSWLEKEFGIENLVKSIPSPKYPLHVIQTFSKEEIEKLIKSCLYTRESQPYNRRSFVMRRPSANRDQALIMFLLDTGLRASELCSLLVGDVDLKTGQVSVRHGVSGGAKGGKGRVTYLGKASKKALWRYLANREDGDDPETPLFLNNASRAFNRNSLRIMIRRLGERAGIPHVHPHKFRHTFAITYLRSGGDVFTLQLLLGHSSLDMVRHYAQVAQSDVATAHRKASPVDNWRL